MREIKSRTLFVAVCAWVSTCLLVIGWLPPLSEALRFLWMVGGLFGLAATVGLNELIKKDVRLQEELLRRYHELAVTDSLTGLANRQSHEEALRSAMSASTLHRIPLCFLMIDIDRFKIINDTWGHQVGDNAIRLVAGAAKEFFHEAGCVARYGGEEFAVTILGIPLPEATVLADRFREQVSNAELTTPDGRIPVTVSIGVAAAIADDTADRLVQRADKALYAAKQSGRNRVQLATDLVFHSTSVTGQAASASRPSESASDRQEQSRNPDLEPLAAV